MRGVWSLSILSSLLFLASCESKLEGLSSDSDNKSSDPTEISTPDVERTTQEVPSQESDEAYALSCEEDHSLSTVESYQMLCLVGMKDSSAWQGNLESALAILFTDNESKIEGTIADAPQGHTISFVLPRDSFATTNFIKVSLTIDSKESEFEISIDKDGLTALLTWAQGADLGFGRKALHTTSEVLYEITHTGQATVKIQSTSLGDASIDYVGGSFPGTDGTCSQEISEDCTIHLYFTPAVLQSYNETFSLTYTNGIESRSLDLSVTGQGILAATQVLAQEDINQGDINAGGSANLPYGLNKPGGIHYDGTHFIVADTEHNRVLLWNSMPMNNQTPPDVVLGQPDLDSTDANQGGTASAATLNKPYGVYSDGNNIYVSDTENNRVLIWIGIPTTNGQAADRILGQGAADEVAAFRPGVGFAANNSLWFPKGITGDGNNLFLCDFENHRVLVWNSLPPVNDEGANVVLGQSNFTTRNSNDGGLAATSMFYPTGVAANDGKVIVSDWENNRLLIWNQVPTVDQTAANLVLGQSTFNNNSANQGGMEPSAQSLKRPRSAYTSNDQLVVSDWDNNRILIWNSFPTTDGQSADNVFGQTSFATSGGNSGLAGPTAESVHFPTGILVSGKELIISDSKNHRLIKVPLP